MRTKLLFAVLCLLLTIPAGLGHARAQTPVAALEWAPCPPGVTGAATPEPAVVSGLECATARVPLDYADPTGEQITIGLNRLPARDPSQRIGSLIVNPGGPGAAGSALVALEASGTPVQPNGDLLAGPL